MQTSIRVLTVALAAIVLTAGLASSQASQSRLVLFEGFYRPT